MYALGYPLFSAVTILDYLLLIYTFIIIAVVVLSWTNPDPLNPIVRILRNLTEPVFDRVRPYVPLVGGLDLTPVVIIVAIYFFQHGVLKVISRFAWEISN
ncbi:MAG: YggT family protein [Proteobacteria bacterium]|nr:YggT family protein [Pseudomonadota bacterium]